MMKEQIIDNQQVIFEKIEKMPKKSMEKNLLMELMNCVIGQPINNGYFEIHQEITEDDKFQIVAKKDDDVYCFEFDEQQPNIKLTHSRTPSNDTYTRLNNRLIKTIGIYLPKQKKEPLISESEEQISGAVSAEIMNILKRQKYLFDKLAETQQKLNLLLAS